MIDPIFLSDTLYDIDPFHTGCQQEECVEEYDSFAQCVVDYINCGQSIKDSIRKVSDEWFSLQMEPSDMRLLLNTIDDFLNNYQSVVERKDAK